MKYLPLVWSGIWRKPGRTILIFLQVAVAFVLFGVLQGLKTGVEHAVADARADLMIVHTRENFFSPLPLGLLEQIRSVPGVKVVVPVELFVGWYQKPEEATIVVAVSPEGDWTDAFTFHMSPRDLAAFNAARTGALVTEFAAEKYHWKIGDHIPLMSNTPQKNGSTTWAFDVAGTFTDSDVGAGLRSKIIMHYAYYDEARASGTGTVNHFNLAVTDANLAVPAADAIDRRFANSSHETKTESLRELAQTNVQRIGDLDFLIRAVVSAVLAALLFATATMMMQSVRERTPELAVLKTIGFTDRAVFLLILAEAVVVCVAAAACGLALATLVFPLAARFVVGLAMPNATVAIGLALGAVLAVVSAAIPAIRAARLRVVSALAER